MSFDDLPPLNTSAEDLKALMDEMKDSGAQLELEGAGPMGRETICLNNESRLPAALFFLLVSRFRSSQASKPKLARR